MVLQLHTAIRRLSASPGPRNHGQSAKIGKLREGAFDVVILWIVYRSLLERGARVNLYDLSVLWF